MRVFGAILFVLLSCACGAKSPATKTAVDPVVSGVDAGPAKTCDSSAECGPGMMCDGPAGCGKPWTCVKQRPCTKDLVNYCGCDGQTLRGSGSCPPGPFQHVGECE